MAKETDDLAIPDFLKVTPARQKHLSSLPLPRHQLGTRTADQIRVRPPEEQTKPERRSRYLAIANGAYIDSQTGQEYCDWAAVVQSWNVRKDPAKVAMGDFKKAIKKGAARVTSRGAVIRPERAEKVAKVKKPAPDDDLNGLKIEGLLVIAKKLGYKELAEWPNGGVRVMRCRNFIRNARKTKK